MDIHIKNASLIGRQGTVDIGIDGGKITAIADFIQDEAARVIDAQGKLVSPAFIDPHTHLDKTNIVDVVRPNVSGALKEAIEIIWDKKANYTIEDIVERAGRTIILASQHGATRMRTHVDVDTIGKLLPMRGTMEARKKYESIMDIQIVAFPQEGIIQNPGADKLMRQAMEMGAELVGGMPANEKTPADSERHVQFCFDLAREFNAGIDMHVDETDDPFYRTLEMICDRTMETGWEGRVTAGHTVALAAYDERYANYVMDKVKEAGVNVITNPATNLMLQGRNDRWPVRRGVTRVKDLLKRGVTVSFGQDCNRDTFYPFGQEDMLEVALITAHAAHMSLPEEIQAVFEMITTKAARILGIDDYGIEVGKRADLILLDCNSVTDAIRLHPERLYVIKNGRIVAESRTERHMYL